MRGYLSKGIEQEQASWPEQLLPEPGCKLFRQGIVALQEVDQCFTHIRITAQEFLCYCSQPEIDRHHERSWRMRSRLQERQLLLRHPPRLVLQQPAFARAWTSQEHRPLERETHLVPLGYSRLDPRLRVHFQRLPPGERLRFRASSCPRRQFTALRLFLPLASWRALVHPHRLLDLVDVQMSWEVLWYLREALHKPFQGHGELVGDLPVCLGQHL